MTIGAKMSVPASVGVLLSAICVGLSAFFEAAGGQTIADLGTVCLAYAGGHYVIACPQTSLAYATDSVSTIRGWVPKVSVPWWVLAAVLGFAPLVASRLLRWRAAARPSKDAVCRKCGYDLRATPDRCPECGQDTKSASK